ncbi:MAG: hypothetical protein KKF12_15715 [Proteobacteria bacterium]|nr:hypothetical protein [Desulfobacula sp.]MBU3951419.1 hypothetical protein [Pseudomonadota bacterium]MBU4132261.1 hypothetical protein [Pseudomonadota bacterium]
MKISDARLTITSRNFSEQMDLLLKEESRTNLIGTVSGSSRKRSVSMGTVESFLPTMVVDRVSISQDRQVEYQSGYTGTIVSKSVVQSAVTGEIHVFEQEKMVEALVGGVIDRDVVVRQLARGEIVHMDTGSKHPGLPMNEGSISFQSLSGGMQISIKQTEFYFQEEQMVFASAGEVVTEDGRTIGFSLDIAMDRAFLSKTEQETLVRTWKERVVLTDPLVIGLDGGLPQLSDASFEFDLDADGKTEKISFASPGSGFLAFDRNNDGKINDGSELFGPGTGNGFEELAELDGDQNHWIDENDAVFSKLSVWTKDKNGQDRLISLKDAGIGAISLENALTFFDMTSMENTLKGRLKRSGVFLFENGNVGSIQQIDLAARPAESDRDKSELNISVKDTRSGGAASQVSDPPVLFAFPRSLTKPSEGQAAENPLESLLEQVKAMREKMNQILGERSDAHGLNQWPNIRWKKNGFALTNYQAYQIINPDPFVLFSGRKGRVGEMEG